MHADIGLSFLNTEDRNAIRPASRRQPDAVGLETLGDGSDQDTETAADSSV